MPKERVHHGDILRYTPEMTKDGEPSDTTVRSYDGGPLQDKEYIREEPSFEINWSKEYGHVQVAIDFSREQWLECSKDLEDNPEVIRKAIYTSGWSRSDINNAIRVLRRARDQAFGADE